MAFLSGPRQAGKTTLAKAFLPSMVHPSNYGNWDQGSFKLKWMKNPEALAEAVIASGHPILILDELHKNPKWKNQLKGFYDQYAKLIKVIVTGSARLNTFRKGADSLLGRFFHFHIMPLTLGEVLATHALSFKALEEWIQNPAVAFNNQQPRRKQETVIENLLDFGGFPEPFLEKSSAIYQIWSQNRIELLIRQDLRDLSNILQIGQVELLASFLPDRVGFPISLKSLQEDLDGSYSSIQRWLAALAGVYYHFDVKPYSKSIPRSLKKEGKIYLYDWRQVESLGPRFENMVALHLLKALHFYNDTGQAHLGLFYLRNKEQTEVDFLVTNKGKPFFTMEVKFGDKHLDKSYLSYQKHLNVPHFQIVRSAEVFDRYPNATVVSFGDFFAMLP
jgi:predicted AAA+ superfamily ATPase